jgi:ATP-dependent Clp protease protease subunit
MEAIVNKLLAFYRANKGKGQGFQAMDGDEPTLMVYDVIVSSEADAEWLGGAPADAFVRALRGMSAERVHVRINSPGGDAFAGIAMANAIRAYPGEVVVHVDGYAASAASFLVAAAERVVMGAGAMVMVHKAWTIALGNSDDLMAQASVLEKLDGEQAEMFRAKSPDYDWEAALSAETWFTADEAIGIGLASEKAGDYDKRPRALAFDLSAFERAPVIEQPEEIAPVAQDDDDVVNIERRKRIARIAALRVA